MRYEIILSRNSKPLPEEIDVIGRTENLIEIEKPEDSEIPIPWDANVVVDKDGYLILTGYAGCSGWGRCQTEIPISPNLRNALRLYIETKDTTLIEELLTFNWICVVQKD